jgi:8-oxo-dGTP pyrophosphatase MutT (NUDIX family)
MKRHEFIDQLHQQLLADLPEIDPDMDARPAAVLAPLYWHQEAWHLLYTRRTEAVETHRGQVSFPGGVIERGDKDATDAALREAEEEIGLRASDVEVIGYLEPYLTITHYCIIPIVGTIPWPYNLHINPREVASTFGVPLEWLAYACNLQVTQYEREGTGQKALVYYFLPYQGETIWGATARITLNLLEKMGLTSGNHEDLLHD